MSDSNERLEYAYAYGRLFELVRQYLEGYIDIAHLRERFPLIERDLTRGVTFSDGSRTD